jgi:hypothetical protein
LFCALGAPALGGESLPLRQLGKCKLEEVTSSRRWRDSTRTWKGFLDEKEKDLSMKGKRNFSSIF